jgi:hypothetical protein
MRIRTIGLCQLTSLASAPMKTDATLDRIARRCGCGFAPGACYEGCVISYSCMPSVLMVELRGTSACSPSETAKVRRVLNDLMPES